MTDATVKAGPFGYPVLVIDDHELFSTSLRLALRGHGFAARQLHIQSLVELRKQIGHHPPGLAVLDLDLGHDEHGRWLNGVELIDPLRAAGWQVLVVSGSVDTPRVAAAIAAGAVGSVPKSSSFRALLEVVMAAASGQPVMAEAERAQWLAQHESQQEQQREVAGKLARLSGREREVLELLVEGRRAAEIAQRFVVSMTTVRTQIRNLLAKLEVSSQLEAVALVRESTRW
jgi:DNA-binding NarL/FixJ family response regulator